MAEKKIKWLKLVNSKNELHWEDKSLIVAEVEGKKITLAKIGDKMYACAYKCPHASGILAEGYIDAVGNITCPLHRYKFRLENGRNVSGEGYYLKTYLIEERPSGVYIGFEENNWMNIFK